VDHEADLNKQDLNPDSTRMNVVNPDLSEDPKKVNLPDVGLGYTLNLT
jgi:hypothetical protein